MNDSDTSLLLQPVKSTSNKVTYRYAVYRGAIYTLGDIICLNSSEEMDYYGVIENLYTKKGVNIMYVRWFYRWSDLAEIQPDFDGEYPNELFYSYHFDENPVETIQSLGKVKVLKFTDNPAEIPPDGVFTRCIFDSIRKKFHRISEKELQTNLNNQDLQVCLSRLLYLSSIKPISTNFLTTDDLNRKYLNQDSPTKYTMFSLNLPESNQEVISPLRKKGRPAKLTPVQAIQSQKKSISTKKKARDAHSIIDLEEEVVSFNNVEKKKGKKKETGRVVKSSLEVAKNSALAPSTPQKKLSFVLTEDTIDSNDESDSENESFQDLEDEFTPRKRRKSDRLKRKQAPVHEEIEIEETYHPHIDEVHEKKELASSSDFKKYLTEGFEKFFNDSLHLPWSSQDPINRDNAVKYIHNLTNFPDKQIRYKLQQMILQHQKQNKSLVQSPVAKRRRFQDDEDENLWKKKEDDHDQFNNWNNDNYNNDRGSNSWGRNNDWNNKGDSSNSWGKNNTQRDSGDKWGNNSSKVDTSNSWSLNNNNNQSQNWIKSNSTSSDSWNKSSSGDNNSNSWGNKNNSNSSSGWNKPNSATSNSTGWGGSSASPSTSGWGSSNTTSSTSGGKSPNPLSANAPNKSQNTGWGGGSASPSTSGWGKSTTQPSVNSWNKPSEPASSSWKSNSNDFSSSSPPNSFSDIVVSSNESWKKNDDSIDLLAKIQQQYGTVQNKPFYDTNAPPRGLTSPVRLDSTPDTSSSSSWNQPEKSSSGWGSQPSNSNSGWSQSNTTSTASSWNKPNNSANTWSQSSSPSTTSNQSNSAGWGQPNSSTSWNSNSVSPSDPPRENRRRDPRAARFLNTNSDSNNTNSQNSETTSNQSGWGTSSASSPDSSKSLNSSANAWGTPIASDAWGSSPLSNSWGTPKSNNTPTNAWGASPSSSNSISNSTVSPPVPVIDSSPKSIKDAWSEKSKTAKEWGETSEPIELLRAISTTSNFSEFRKDKTPPKSTVTLPSNSWGTPNSKNTSTNAWGASSSSSSNNSWGTPKSTNAWGSSPSSSLNNSCGTPKSNDSLSNETSPSSASNSQSSPPSLSSSNNSWGTPKSTAPTPSNSSVTPKSNTPNIASDAPSSASNSWDTPKSDNTSTNAWGTSPSSSSNNSWGAPKSNNAWSSSPSSSLNNSCGTPKSSLSNETAPSSVPTDSRSSPKSTNQSPKSTYPRETDKTNLNTSTDSTNTIVTSEEEEEGEILDSEPAIEDNISESKSISSEPDSERITIEEDVATDEDYLTENSDKEDGTPKVKNNSPRSVNSASQYSPNSGSITPIFLRNIVDDRLDDATDKNELQHKISNSQQEKKSETLPTNSWGTKSIENKSQSNSEGWGKSTSNSSGGWGSSNSTSWTNASNDKNNKEQEKELKNSSEKQNKSLSSSWGSSSWGSSESLGSSRDSIDINRTPERRGNESSNFSTSTGWGSSSGEWGNKGNDNSRSEGRGKSTPVSSGSWGSKASESIPISPSSSGEWGKSTPNSGVSSGSWGSKANESISTSPSSGGWGKSSNSGTSPGSWSSNNKNTQTSPIIQNNNNNKWGSSSGSWGSKASESIPTSPSSTGGWGKSTLNTSGTSPGSWSSKANESIPISPSSTGGWGKSTLNTSGTSPGSWGSKASESIPISPSSSEGWGKSTPISSGTLSGSWSSKAIENVLTSPSSSEGWGKSSANSSGSGWGKSTSNSSGSWGSKANESISTSPSSSGEWGKSTSNSGTSPGSWGSNNNNTQTSPIIQNNHNDKWGSSSASWGSKPNDVSPVKSPANNSTSWNKSDSPSKPSNESWGNSSGGWGNQSSNRDSNHHHGGNISTSQDSLDSFNSSSDNFGGNLDIRSSIDHDNFSNNSSSSHFPKRVDPKTWDNQEEKTTDEIDLDMNELSPQFYQYPHHSTHEKTWDTLLSNGTVADSSNSTSEPHSITSAKLISDMTRDPRLNSQIRNRPFTKYNGNSIYKLRYTIWKAPKTKISYVPPLALATQSQIQIDLNVFRQFVLTKNTVTTILSNPYFNNLIVGFWVKIAIKKGEKRAYVIAEVASVVENNEEYLIAKNLKSSKLLLLQLPGVAYKEYFPIPFISNKAATFAEFKNWEKKLLKIRSQEQMSLSFENLANKKPLLFSNF